MPTYELTRPEAIDLQPWPGDFGDDVASAYRQRDRLLAIVGLMALAAVMLLLAMLLWMAHAETQALENEFGLTNDESSSQLVAVD